MALVLDGSTGIVSANIADGTISASDLASGAITSAALPAGSVLQVVQAFKSDTWSTTNTTFTDVSGLSLSITPRSTNSKIYLIVYFGRVSNIGSSYYTNAWRFVRNSTPIGVGDLSGVRYQAGMTTTHWDTYYDGNGSMFYLDSPSTTSAITYKVQGAGHGSGTVLLNYSEGDANTAGMGYVSRTASNLIAMEIG